MFRSRFIIGRLLPNLKFAICCLATGRRKVAWCYRDGQHVFRVLLVFKASRTESWVVVGWILPSPWSQVKSSFSLGSESASSAILSRSRSVQKVPSVGWRRRDARLGGRYRLLVLRPSLLQLQWLLCFAFPKSTSAWEEDREGEMLTEMLSMLEKAVEWRKGRRRGR